ncbi:acyltransferase [Chromobacterium alkanivorans]|uniref:acyltransferase family protein n=1 Tax=Chromobacterium TaxID=535 RepID=UPI00069CE0BE|nr:MULTISPECIES: acyltransferase family protein [Chromobacterium]MBN3004033.1 acyltransferase [Chromobacterium alkanivorans]
MSLTLNSCIDAKAYRPDIDGLRALAVLSVVAFHIGLPGFGGGFVGVDIFFVISGFLISGLLRQELLAQGRIDFKAFYARRIRRLAPALALVLISSLILAYFVMLPDDQIKLGREVRAVATLSANHHFLKHAFDYFDSDADLKVLLHTWSLAVEEQYYLVWPLLLWGVFRLSKADRHVTDARMRLTLGAVLLGSLALSLWLSYRDTPQAFYLMPARAWEFAAGALLAVLPPPRKGRRWALPIAALGLALLLGSIALLNERMVFPGVIVLLPVAGSVLFILAGMLDPSNPISRCIGSRPWTSIGLLSYGFYLWHWPLLALGRYWGLGERDLTRDLLLGGVLALALAWLSYRYVEQPLRRGQWRKLRDVKPTLRTGLSITLGLWLLGTVAMYLPKHFPWPGQQSILQAKSDAFHFVGDCGMPADGTPLPPRAQCLIGAPGAPLKLLAWGDSHTDHLMPLYDALAKERGVAILRRVYHGCPPLADAMPVGEGKKRSWCPSFARAVRAELPQLAAQGVTGVLLNARWNSYTAQDLPGRPAMTGLVAAGLEGIPGVSGGMKAGVAPLDRASSLQVLEQSLDRSAQDMAGLGLKVVLVLPEAEMSKSPPECVARLGAAACDAPRAEVESRRLQIVQLLQRVAARHANIRLWDPLDQFCDAKTCFASRDGKVRYQDKDHITASMALTLTDSFRPSFDWAQSAGR